MQLTVWLHLHRIGRLRLVSWQIGRRFDAWIWCLGCVDSGKLLRCFTKRIAQLLLHLRVELLLIFGCGGVAQNARVACVRARRRQLCRTGGFQGLLALDDDAAQFGVTLVSDW